MKKLLFFILLSSITLPAFAIAMSSKIDTITILATNGITSLPTNKTLQQQLGRETTLKEKLALLILKKWYKKEIHKKAMLDKKANATAVLAFTLSLLGIVFLPFIIPAFILSNHVLKKENEKPGLLTPTNKFLVKFAKNFSIAWGILILIFAIIIIVLFSNLNGAK
ncbi:MAG: hypothetical protein H7320_16095 [Ferruginibacter sp.]|nr:hypothetical protein [Ferruginibacter sp.]